MWWVRLLTKNKQKKKQTKKQTRKKQKPAKHFIDILSISITHLFYFPFNLLTNFLIGQSNGPSLSKSLETVRRKQGKP